MRTATNWLKLGGTVAVVGAIALLELHHRWFFMSCLGYYPMGCNEEALEVYLERGGSSSLLVARANSALG